METGSFCSIIVPAIVTVATTLIVEIGKRVIQGVDAEKQWIILREKSTVDIMYSNLLRTSMIGIIPVILYIYLCVIFSVFTKGTFSLDAWYPCIYFIISIGYHAYLMNVKIPRSMLRIKRNIKEKYVWIIYKLPILFSFFLWGFAFFPKALKVATAIAVIIVIVYAVIVPIFFDKNEKYKYQYAKIHLANGKILNDISIGEIRKKNSWIIATNNKTHMEYRFRVKDLDHIVYYGEKN